MATVKLETQQIRDWETFHSVCQQNLGFAAFYGRNMNAWIDCLTYLDEGDGASIVFAHGNPTSSYLWRNVMPACRGLGRLIACDMIGMGDSEKLPDSGPDRYTYAEQRSFLFALWKNLGVDKDVVFVLHDWGSLLKIVERYV